jgi:hypothetical protein
MPRVAPVTSAILMGWTDISSEFYRRGKER